MTKRCALVALLIVFIVSSSTFAEDPRRDGNWWNATDRQDRIAYALGFFDGLNLGSSFAVWGIPAGDIAIKKATDSYNFCLSTYLKDVTNGQLADGLDDFYKDYRNRRILVMSAIWLVANSIAGTPKDKLDVLIENFRRGAK